MSIKLSFNSLPTIPDDLVHFKVEVDHSRCSAISGPMQIRLNNLTTNGFETQISRIIAFSGIHYNNSIFDYSNIGNERTLIARAWGNLCHWQPRSISINKNGKIVNKLVFSNNNNPNDQRTTSEILGVGAGLLLARYVYQRPYRCWSSLGHGRMDYSSVTPDGKKTIRVELRGRFDRNDWKRAKTQIEEKITQGSNFDLNAGIIFAPRTTARARESDFFIMDPPGNEISHISFAPFRDLLKHYAPQFIVQGFRVFGERLLELADTEDMNFEEYLNNGDIILQNATTGRVGFIIGNTKFKGTVWDGIAWPLRDNLNDMYRYGYFFDGLAFPVLNALIKGELNDILEMDIEEYYSNNDDFIRIVLDDGRALVWASSLVHLLEHY